MATKKDQRSGGKDVEAEVWTAITAFEQILEAMPTDRASLEALSHAYEQIGDHTKAKEYLFRFGTVLLEENDTKTASELVENLAKYASEDERIGDLIRQIEEMSKRHAEESSKAQTARKAAKVKADGKEMLKTGFNMQEEMSFAWNLSEAGLLTQEEYANVVQDLTELSTSADNSTVSVLHVLENRGFKNLEKMIGHVSRECGSPIISLVSFSPVPEAVAMLPFDFMRKRGVLLFDVMGKDALGVVMNPYDKQLRKDVESVAGRKCHFYMTLPSEFDKTLEKVPDILEAMERK